jgi:hypothetical protein
MKADQHIYEFMYRRIPDVIQGSEVLELATGPGLLAKHIAPAARRCRHASQWYMRSVSEIKRLKMEKCNVQSDKSYRCRDKKDRRCVC